jgi:hypothetical protein
MVAKKTFWRRGDGYLMLTGERPKGFDNLFVGLAGNDPNDPEEILVDQNLLKQWTQIEDYEVPEEWHSVFGIKAETVNCPVEEGDPRVEVIKVEPLPEVVPPDRVRPKTDIVTNVQKAALLFIFGSVCLFTAVIVLFASTHETSGYRGRPVTQTIDYGDRYDAEYYAEQFVLRKLKSPSTAVFSGVKGRHVKKGIYTVSGDVDAQNGFGATIRKSFVCEVQSNGQGQWSLNGLRFR